MSELYLILHKVRGEPAFDIAQRMGVDGDDEPWWIIPTSGHRAYPYQTWEFNSLRSQEDGGEIWDLYQNPMPDDWPDHCSIHTDLQRRPPGRIRALMEKLKLGPKLRLRGF
jgi:hypothetical protein